MDKLRAMQTFVRVVESGSFSAVARESHATQSAVSKQVAALERLLGVKLLVRTTRSLAVTDDGAHYFEQARRLVAEIAEAEGQLKQGEQQLKGALRVGASVGFGRLHLLPLVQSFLQKHPEVRIDLRLDDGFSDLVEQGIEVAIRIGELPDSRLLARSIGTSRREVLAHRDYLRTRPRPQRRLKSPADLVHHNCIVYTEASMSGAWRLQHAPGTGDPAGAVQTIKVSGNLQTNSSEVIRGSVLAGMGVGYAPSWLFAQEIAQGDVVRLLPDWSIPSPIHLVMPQERRHSARVKAFADFVAGGLRLS